MAFVAPVCGFRRTGPRHLRPLPHSTLKEPQPAALCLPATPCRVLSLVQRPALRDFCLAQALGGFFLPNWQKITTATTVLYDVVKHADFHCNGFRTGLSSQKPAQALLSRAASCLSNRLYQAHGSCGKWLLLKGDSFCYYPCLTSEHSACVGTNSAAGQLHLNQVFKRSSAEH